MRGFDEAVSESAQGGAPGAYMVCIGGYPRESAPSFAAAAARALTMARFEADADFPIYEVETGIHFDVPLDPRFDPGVAPSAFEPFWLAGE